MKFEVKPVTIEPCFGNKGCPNSISNSENLIKKIQQIINEEKLEDFILSKVNGKLKMHNTFRIGIANCPNACSQVHIKDFGIILKAKVKYIQEKCNLCKKCVKTCPDRAIYFEENKITIDYDKCLSCGLCARICPEQAIIVEKTGYQVLIGGKLGRHPFLAIEIKNFVENDEKLLDIFRKVLYFYKENNISGERLGAIIQKKGLSEINENIK